MLLFELKKIFSKSSNKIVCLLLAITLGVICYFAVGYVTYVDKNGESSSGFVAAQTLRKEKNQWAGYITEDVLRKVIEENTLINKSKEYLSDDVRENNKAYSKKQGFSDIREMINRAFCGFQEYNYYRADSVTKKDINSFYDRRTAILNEWLNAEEQENYYSENEKQFLIEQYEKLKTPLYYEYADGWEALLEYAPSIIMLLMLIVSFLVSGIFADEIQLKADCIFFSTKLGRNKAVAAKLGAGLVVITLIYWITMLLYSGIVLTLLGYDGANCVIQSGFANWKSFYNITYLQDYLLTVFGGYLGNLFILTLSMLVSAKTRSKTLAVAIPFILLFIPSFLNGISVLSEVLGLLPDQLLQICTVIKMFNLYEIGGKIVGSVSILFTIYPILLFVLLPFIYGIYRKHQCT